MAIHLNLRRFTTDRDETYAKTNQSKSKTRAEVSNVMLSNGLMTSSKDLQQLSCYSDCCSKGKRPKLALCSALCLWDSSKCAVGDSFRKIALFGHSFSFATNLECCFHGISLIFTIHTERVFIILVDMVFCMWMDVIGYMVRFAHAHTPYYVHYYHFITHWPSQLHQKHQLVFHLQCSYVENGSGEWVK